MDRCDHLFPLLSDLVVRVDAAGVILAAEGNLASFGHLPGELVGCELRSYLRDDEWDAFHRSRTAPMQVSFRRRRMGVDAVAEDFVPAMARSSADGAIAVFSNVGRLSELESLVQRSKDQLFEQEKMASIGQLAAGVAHEINNPLGFVTSNVAILATYITPIRDILAAVQALVDASRGEVAGEVAGRAREVAALAETHDIGFVIGDIEGLARESLEGLERIKQIVMGLRLYARRDSGEKSQADLNAVVDAALGILHTKLRHQCQVVRAYAAPMPLVEMDVQRMTQVFVNLIANGAEAITGQGTITLRTYEQDGLVWCDVQDDGSGVPAEIRGRIFEPLFTTKAPGKGTGLGLSISAEIVRAHQGRLLLESQLGVGTTFRVGLPLKQPAA
ncbi:MAG: ATP-binding protein [Deltaproteobacteria bacterium]|nr:ATP-binding protein [Deltaproteobacteria bacterium]